MAADYDICIIGSGAGGGPVALTLAQAGYHVLVLEKGPWFTDADFYKDELACCRRSIYTPRLWEEPHVIEDRDRQGTWRAIPTSESGRDFWNGNCVGGATNFMSGFFHRMKPDDFRLLSAFGAIDGANITDWPISYQDLEPYYARVESEVGVSGRVVPHPHLEPRSTADFPHPPTAEHPIAAWIDTACNQLGYHSIPVPRAILPHPVAGRGACSYSDYCGSYGCSTGAKGSSRSALLERALATGHCEIRPLAQVYRLENGPDGRISAVHYYDRHGAGRRVDARVYVVACQPVETARLLLLSTGPRHRDGLANGTGQVGRNLVFSAGGSGGGDFPYHDLDLDRAAELAVRGPFVNRALQDWYTYRDPDDGRMRKGGTIDFLFRHANPIARANSLKWGKDGLIWGRALQERLKSAFTDARNLRFEVFCDWSPVDNCRVTLDSSVTDKWGTPVARIRTAFHRHDLVVGRYLAARGEEVLRAMGARDIRSGISGSPPPNLVAGGCRFGRDPAHSVLDPDCRAHEVENLYVTDGSFMPTGGSVPYTWTIYANAFRVAERIREELGHARAAAA